MALQNHKKLTNGYSVKSQTPIDDRLVFDTAIAAANLGASDVEAFRYYEGMQIWCLDMNKGYVWIESTAGLIVGGYTYPAGVTIPGANGTIVSYGGRTFNFVETGIVTAVFPTVYTSTGDILASVPLVEVITGSADILDVSVYDSSENDISDGIHIQRTVPADTVTFSSNVNLIGVQIKILYMSL